MVRAGLSGVVCFTDLYEINQSVNPISGVGLV